MKTKAGFIPTYKGQMLFCLSSDPAFGGDRYAIAKGGIDHDEKAFHAAVREAQEELGLRLSNVKWETVKRLGEFDQSGQDSNYTLQVWVGEVYNLENFDEPCWEIASTRWMTASEFLNDGRELHKPIIEALVHNLA